MLTDVTYNWRKAKIGVAFKPTLGELTSGTVKVSNVVFLPWGSWGEDVFAVRNWIQENCVGVYKIYARFEWQKNHAETKKTICGLTFEFYDPMDIVYFMLRWASTTST